MSFWNAVEETDQDIRVAVLRRYRRIAAHLICESLGYFTPYSAANAIIAAKKGEPFYCEWYTHMARGFEEEKVRKVTRNVLRWAIERRHHHEGYMAEYTHALAIVNRVLQAGQEPGGMLASWF